MSERRSRAVQDARDGIAQALVGQDRYADFRRSDNIDDRRNESLWSKYNPQNLANFPTVEELKTMVQHPMTPTDQLFPHWWTIPAQPPTELGVQAGVNDLEQQGIVK